MCLPSRRAALNKRECNPDLKHMRGTRPNFMLLYLRSGELYKSVCRDSSDVMEKFDGRLTRGDDLFPMPRSYVATVQKKCTLYQSPCYHTSTSEGRKHSLWGACGNIGQDRHGLPFGCSQAARIPRVGYANGKMFETRIGGVDISICTMVCRGSIFFTYREHHVIALRNKRWVAKQFLAGRDGKFDLAQHKSGIVRHYGIRPPPT